MNQVFPQTGLTSQGANSSPVWVPPIEVGYRDGNLVVSAELPGLKDEDITVAIRDDAIVIEGERQIRHEENEGGVHRTELRYGQFYRAIPLPEGADVENARAEFKDGVLQVSVPVPQEQRNERQIPVETSGSSQSASSQSASSKTTESASTETSGTKKAA
jgi:HSP20 family protein